MTLPFSKEINNKPSFFIEKIWLGLLENGLSDNDNFLRYQAYYKNTVSEDWISDIQLSPKIHTIRRGERWTARMPMQLAIELSNGEIFNFAPEITCISTQLIEIDYSPNFQVSIDGNRIDLETIEILTRNDGFESLTAFKSYFNSDFKGQIVHWTNLEYIANSD